MCFKDVLKMSHETFYDLISDIVLSGKGGFGDIFRGRVSIVKISMLDKDRNNAGDVRTA